MKILYLVFVLVVAILAVVFAAQNSAVVAISFFSWSASGSLSLVLILTLSLGILIGLLIMAPSVFKRWFQSSGLKRRLHRLEKEQGEAATMKPSQAAPLVEQARTQGAEETASPSIGDGVSTNGTDNASGIAKGTSR